LAEHPELATAPIGDEGMTRTLLHAATDWPGHHPKNAASVRALIEAGADVNARCAGPHGETPLHWAASSDDVEVLDALLDAGADIEARGAVIAGGTPIADATAFGQWNAARRLIERGARSNSFESATLGLLDRVRAEVEGDPPLEPEYVTGSFWGACHGGQLETARYLLAHGADHSWVSTWDGLTPLDAARRSEAADVVAWLLEQGARSAQSAG
jgi:ankyrin repeat protein